ncbi:MAG: hypothetical protein ACOC5F_00535 [Candidatus Aminicenantaceae bacterium]
MKKVKLLIGFLVIFPILLLTSCAPPVEIMPQYYEYESHIEVIALYPLIYIQDGPENREFGRVFTEIFYNEVNASSYIRPLNFVMPESTVGIFENVGVPVEDEVYGIFDRADRTTSFPVYKNLNAYDFMAVSDMVDAVFVCELERYNEVSAGEELGQAFLTACLTAGMMSASEDNFVKMRIYLFSTMDGTCLWEYDPYFSRALSEREKTREKFSFNIVDGFRMYFPLSREYEE